MAIYDLWLSRNNGPTIANYVGHAGRLFYDPAERVLRISDGTTAGGSVFNGLVTVTNIAPTTNFQGQVWLNPENSDLTVYHNGNFISTINVATSTKLGGVKLGPGVTTNGAGQIIIDSSGLDFSFGDLASTVGTYTDTSEYAILKSINTNEDLVLASNGTGGIHIVGEFRINRTNGALTATLEANPVFEVKSDGQVKILVPEIDSTGGAVSIVGSSTGAFISPVNTGVMLHVTGQYDTPSIPSRIYNDAQGSFAAFVARRFNGTVASPTAVLADEEIMRISGTAHDGTSIPGAGNSRIVYKTLGNQTLTNHGAVIELWTTPLNSTTLAKVVTINNADGITSTKFTGPLTGNVTGDVTGNVTGNAGTVTNGVYTNGSYANPAWITSLAASKVGLGSVENTALSTSTHYIGTTSIQYNRASASQSLTGVSIDGSAGSVAAANITGTTLASGVTGSSLTSVGTLTNLAIATNGTITTPRIVINDGGLRTVSGGTTLTINFATDSIILWTAPSGTAVITLSNYTAGAQVKLIIAMTTSRDITFGIASAALSSTGLDNWNGVGGGSIDITNTAVHLEYTCITALAAGCYVKVTAN